MQINTNEEEEKKDSDATVACKFCNASVVGAPLRWEAESVIPVGALIDHIKQCQQFLACQERVNKFATEWKAHLKE